MLIGLILFSVGFLRSFWVYVILLEPNQYLGLKAETLSWSIFTVDVTLGKFKNLMPSLRCIKSSFLNWLFFDPVAVAFTVSRFYVSTIFPKACVDLALENWLDWFTKNWLFESTLLICGSYFFIFSIKFFSDIYFI